MRNKRVLITCGPTWVAIDPVRVISNRSTGELGHFIAGGLEKEGAKVTLLEGPVREPLRSKKIKIIKFLFFAELRNLLDRQLQNHYDCIIHAAAVSDYQPKKIFSNKLDSHSDKLTLDLVPTEKLINRIKRRSPSTFLIGFKLDSDPIRGSLIKKANQLSDESHCNWVVANSVIRNKYSGIILENGTNVIGQARSREQMAATLIKLLKGKI